MKNIYVGNLAFGANEEEIRSLFEQYGQVDRVQIITDRDTGQSRGFAFVEMPEDGQAQAAIEALNGKPAFGRTLSVNEARPRAERPQRGGERGGRNRPQRDNRRQHF